MKRKPGHVVKTFEIRTKISPTKVEIRYDFKRKIYLAWFNGEIIESEVQAWEGPGLKDFEALLTKLGMEFEATSFTFQKYIEYRLIEKGHSVGLVVRVIEVSDEMCGRGRAFRPCNMQLDAFQEDDSKTTNYLPADGTKLVPYTFTRLCAFNKMIELIDNLRTQLRAFLSHEDLISMLDKFVMPSALVVVENEMSDRAATVAASD